MPITARRHWMAGVGLGVGWARAAATERPRVLVPGDVLHDALALLNGRDPRQIHRFDATLARRDVVEFLLLHQALDEALLPTQALPTAARLLIELGSGRGALSGTSFQQQDLAEGVAGVALSAPLVLDGEAEAGLYALADNARAMAVRDAADLRHLSAVSNRDWRADWRALEGLGLREVQHVSSWPQMVRMVAAGRADLLLAPFAARDDLLLQVGGVELQPLRGLKLGLPGSRHFLLATRPPGFAALRERLDEGIQRLRRQGLLQRAYRECGFFNRRVKDWRRL